MKWKPASEEELRARGVKPEEIATTEDAVENPAPKRKRKAKE